MDGPTDKSPGPFFGPADSGLRTLDLSLALRTADVGLRINPADCGRRTADCGRRTGGGAVRISEYR